MKKVLILSLHYLDEELGGPNCSKAFVKALATIYPGCSLIYPEHNDRVTDTSMLDGCDVRLIPCIDRRTKMRKVLDMYCGILHRFVKPVREELEKNRYDIVFINTTFMASSGILEMVLAHGCKVVTLHHNVEKDYLKDNPQSILFRYPYNHFFLNAEEKALSKSDLNLTLTEYDCKTFAKLHNERPFEVMGIFEYKDFNTHFHSTCNEHTFVISGSLSAKQTETAVIAFLQEYMPILNRICPDAKLIVTGRNPSNKLCEVCSAYSNITVIANPKNIMDEVKKGAYYIAPIFTGGGLKLRIMDPLRVGLPVLAHEISTRGYEAIIHAGGMFSYNDKTSFERGLRQMMESVKSHKSITDIFQTHFSFDAGKSHLEEILKKYELA